MCENTGSATSVPALLDIDGCRQGDWIGIYSGPTMGVDGQVKEFSCENGVVVLTQTCDIVQPGRPNLQVAPLMYLDASVLKPAQKGLRPNLVHVPGIADNAFADLSFIFSVDKTNVINRPHRRGLSDDDEIRKFGQHVGRRFSRFAFPDDIVPWFRRLQEVVGSRHGKMNSPVGWVFDQVASLRIECATGWYRYPFEVTLCLVMEPGVLPFLPPDEEPELSIDLRGWLFGGSADLIPRRDMQEIAEMLKREVYESPADRHWLWSSFADRVAARCVPGESASDTIKNAIVGQRVDVDIISTTDYSFERYRHSEELDLDHLSPPLPI